MFKNNEIRKKSYIVLKILNETLVSLSHITYYK